MITFVSSVTAPVSASALPCSVAAVFKVTEADAMMFPMNWLPAPIVAELPTSQ